MAGLKKLKTKIIKKELVQQTTEVKRVNIGVQIRPDLWWDLRALSFKQHRKAWELLEDAIADYLKKNQ